MPVARCSAPDYAALDFQEVSHVLWLKAHDVPDFDVRQPFGNHPVFNGADSNAAQAGHVGFPPVRHLVAVLTMLCHVKTNGIARGTVGSRAGLLL